MQEIMSLDALEDNFSFFDGWEEKYAYLIDLGKKIDALDEAFKVDAYKIDGCTSNVWLVPKITGDKLFFQADSDALIVRGLIAILFAAYNGKALKDVSGVDIDAFFSRIGLDQHLSPNRRNGFFSMVERIRAL